VWNLQTRSAPITSSPIYITHGGRWSKTFPLRSTAQQMPNQREMIPTRMATVATAGGTMLHNDAHSAALLIPIRLQNSFASPTTTAPPARKAFSATCSSFVVVITHICSIRLRSHLLAVHFYPGASLCSGEPSMFSLSPAFGFKRRRLG
jgi:hypothetical protein